MTVPTSAAARYIMVGGFLGAGKTTGVARLGRYLADRGLRVGLIANDQSSGLVDTTLLRSQGFDVAEIAGGCLCCRFNSLVDAANQLTRETRPDVFIAEPVGSCTDLVATVSYPLRRIYGEQFSIAPLSVLVDPKRCARVLGFGEGKSFSDKVVYVYRKQLEEAEIIVINKCDTIDTDQQRELSRALAVSYPRARIVMVSARQGENLEAWYELILDAECASVATMPIDYGTYGEGEALLGWLNATVRLDADERFDGNEFLLQLTDRIRRRLDLAASEIAHLKMTLDSGDGGGNLSVVSLVDSAGAPDLREALLNRIDGGELIVNLRAEGDPEMLRTATLEALDAGTNRIRAVVEHLECFRPAPPRPTHRITMPEVENEAVG